MESPKMSPISIPFPEEGDLHLHIVAGACQITIRPDGGDAWVTGSYSDPSGRIPVRVTEEGGTVRIDHVHTASSLLGLVTGVPVFDLALGKSRPYMLTLDSGASENELDLGGLPITRLIMRQGAGKSAVAFSAPNPQVMSLLQLSSGAAAMVARHLANANAPRLTLEGGAVGDTFDFSGDLRRDTVVTISTGVSSLEIDVPSVTAARITAQSLLSHLDVSDGFTKREGAFWTRAAVEGRSPLLAIQTTVALGLVKLRLTEQVPAELGQGVPVGAV